MSGVRFDAFLFRFWCVRLDAKGAKDRAEIIDAKTGVQGSLGPEVLQA